MKNNVVPVLIIFCASNIHTIEISQCIAPLGMESGLIKDEDISASSSFDHKNVGPHHGRVRTEINGGAWCPQTQATPEFEEYIEINLHSVHMITATETQGRFGNGQGVEYAENYMLEYFRPKLNKWIKYKPRDSQLLLGNINTYLEKKTELDPPILASKIRFLPYSSHMRTVCMRVEIYGCKWTDGIVSYSMPQGDKRGTNWEFYDMSYDGVWDGEKLKYGLGQLTDGQVAANDFKKYFQGDFTEQNWIGWKNDSRGNSPVEIEFEFDKVREFAALHIYANNQFTKDIQIFRQAKIHFSIGGKVFKGEPITYDHMEDRIFDYPRNISIKLHHKVGKYVKVQLFFAARWILLSEITFESLPSTTDHQEEVIVSNKSNRVLVDTYENNNSTVNASQNSDIGQYLGAAIGVLSILLLLLISGGIYGIIQHKRRKRNMSRPLGNDKKMLYGNASLTRTTGGSSSDYSDDRSCDPEYAVPLQPPKSPRTPPNMAHFFPKPPSVPPPTTGYYAAAEICRNVAPYSPPPHPVGQISGTKSSSRGGRYANCGRPYIGP